MKHKYNLKALIGLLFVISFIIFPFHPKINHFFHYSDEQDFLEYDPIISISEAKQYVSKILPKQNVTEKVNGQTKTDKPTSLVYKKQSVAASEKEKPSKSSKKLIPGGQSIGVQLHTLGVVVVGHHLVESNSPGEDADVQVGDIILEMDGTKIKKLDDVKPIVNAAGKEEEKVMMKIKRGKKTIKTSLKPTLNEQDSNYQIGLYIRDATSGIGTVSFIDDDTGKYGALGHVISDSDTKKPIEIHQGKLVRSKITSIEKGSEGIPGEKQANFSMQDEKLGTVTKNSPFGIYGKLKKEKLANFGVKPLPVGLSHEVKKGPAQILTVVEGEKVEKFDIEIINSTPQKSAATKGMVLKITDEELLKKTGGIVQGMSGSPIIQDGKIIGAVTHVFVNDPTSGYGVHIEWMLQEAEIDIFDKQISQILKDAV